MPTLSDFITTAPKPVQPTPTGATYYGNNVATNTTGAGLLTTGGAPAVGGAAPLDANGRVIAKGQTETAVNSANALADAAAKHAADLARQGSTGSNTLYDPTLSDAQNTANENAAKTLANTNGPGTDTSKGGMGLPGVTPYVAPTNGSALNPVQLAQRDQAAAQAQLLLQQAATEKAKREAALTAANAGAPTPPGTSATPANNSPPPGSIGQNTDGSWIMSDGTTIPNVTQPPQADQGQSGSAPTQTPPLPTTPPPASTTDVATTQGDQRTQGTSGTSTGQGTGTGTGQDNGQGTPAPDSTQPTTTGIINQNTTQIAGLDSFIQQNPAWASVFTTQIADIKQRNLDLITQLGKSSAAEASLIPGNSDLEALRTSRTSILDTQHQKAIDLIEANKNLQLDIADTSKQMMQMEKDKAQIQSTLAITNQTRDNIQSELVNRREANKMGIEQDTAGLDWMQRSVDRGNDALNALVSNGQLVQQGYALQISKGYQQAVTSALNTADSQHQTADSNYNDAVASLNQYVTSTETSRRQELIGITKDWLTSKNQIDINTGNQLQTAAGKIEDAMIGMQKFQLQKDWQAQVLGIHIDQFNQDKAIQVGNIMSGAGEKLASTLKAEPAITNFNQVNSRFSVLNDAYQLGQQNPNNRPAADEAFLTSFVEMQTPGTVRFYGGIAGITSENQSTASKLILDAQKLIVSKGPLTDSAREQMMQIAQKEQNGYKSLAEQTQQDYIEKAHNRNAMFPQYQQYAIPDEEFKIPGLDPIAQTNNGSVIGNDGQPTGEIGGTTAPDYSTDGIMGIINGRSNASSSGKGGGSEATYASLGHETQNFYTPITDTAHGGEYDSATVQAWGGHHDGVDIAMPSGTKLPAPASGTVIFAGKDGGWGNSIILKDTNGAEHRLSHLSGFPPDIAEGSHIQAGQLLAYSGSTGNSTGPHLDYRIKVNGKYVDPKLYGSGAPSTIAGNQDMTGSMYGSTNGMMPDNSLLAFMMTDPSSDF